MSRKELPKPKKRLVPEAEPAAQTGDISHVSGDVNVAGKLIQYIETFQERALTHGEEIEKDLRIEINELSNGVHQYLERLKQQVSAVPACGPYKELEAYTLSESQIFFGRDRSIRDLCEAMKRGKLTILQAESGAGKTSLLQAGILPRMITTQELAVLIRPQFENPSHAIKETFIGNLELTPTLARAPLLDFLRRVKGILGHPITLYLILDQFEEFFSKKTLEQDRQEFIRDLAACLNDTTLNVRWVISITTDTFGQLGKFEPYIQNPFSNVESLYLFSRQEALEVIERSARQYGLSFEKELLDCILSDLGHQHDEPIAPTQIQLVCTALYNDIQERGALFTCEHYTKIGGAQEILHDYIGSVLHRKLPPEERGVAYKVFEALVTSEKRRLIRTRDDLELDLRHKGIPPETLEATLDHLVAGRLLRRYGDDPHHIQYEIVHDYLLKEIEIDENVCRIKAAEELLEQGIRNWEKQKLLLAPDALKILESAAAEIPVASTAAALVFLSAIEYDRPTGPWLELISAAQQKSLAASLLLQKRNRKNRKALWLLRSHLTGTERAKVAAARWSLSLWGGIQKGTVAFLIAAGVFVAAIVGVNLTKDTILWREVTGFGSQCLGGNSPADLLVAIDAAEESHVVVYDSRSGTLCETRNTGVKWERSNQSLPRQLAVRSMAVSSNIYLAADQGFYYQTEDLLWHTLEANPEVKNPRSIAVSSDEASIYASTEQDLLYRYDLKTGDGQIVRAPEITGRITDITVNENYFAVSTVDGIWYRQANTEGPWIKFSSQLEQNEMITAIELAAHVQSWQHYFIQPVANDWFLAATDAGTIYSGYLTEEGGLKKEFSQLPVTGASQPIASLAINQYSMFIARSDRLYCQQTWTILDREWWINSKLSRQQPCK